MAQKSKGLGGNPLAKKTATAPRDRGRSLVGALQQEASNAAAAVRTVNLDQLARNPENPEDRWADDGLIASVREVGILVPLTVMSAGVFVEAYPEHAGIVDGRPWVILAGHRRHDAATKAPVADVPVLVRDDLGDRAGEVMIGENLHRSSLSPIQEARAYERNLQRTGLSQRKLADHLGVPQSQISKRLKLLTLPELIHQHIEDGAVDLEAAQRLADALSDERVRARFEEKIQDARYQEGNFWWAQREAEHEAREERRREVGERAAEDEGVPFVADPGQKFGSSWYNHQLHTKTDVTKARKAGTLVIGPSNEGEKPNYFTTVRTKSTRDEKEKAETKARTQARKARRTYLETAPRETLLAAADRWQRLALLHGLSLGGSVTTTARKVCKAQGLGPTTAEDWSWRNEVTAVTSTRIVEDLAGLIAVTLWEEQLCLSHIVAWSPAACQFFDWLVETGYGPNAWELERRKTSEEFNNTLSDSAESLTTDSVESVAGRTGEDA